MQRFETVSAIAAPLPIANVDTDMILPGQFLKTIARTGLGSKLFHSMRFQESGDPKPDFILNRAPWNQAGILIALDNFGCGSSREHAPWSLVDFGIRCIIAPSFADIFYNNCFKNSILPVSLDRQLVEHLLDEVKIPEQALLIVDLDSQIIKCTNGTQFDFAIAEDRKQTLLLGLDEIDQSLTHADEISAWEAGSKNTAPPITGIAATQG